MADNNFDINSLSKRFRCNVCNRAFTTRYSLERHNGTFHNDSEQALSEMEEESESENSTDMEDESEADESETDKNMSEEDTESSDEDSDVEENHVPRMFRKLLKKVYCEHEDKLQQSTNNYIKQNVSANEAIRQAILSNDKAKKTLRRLFIQNIIDINEQRRHPLFKTIMKRANSLMDKGFDENEAIASAVGYRKHAIYNLINFV